MVIIKKKYECMYLWLCEGLCIYVHLGVYIILYTYMKTWFSFWYVNIEIKYNKNNKCSRVTVWYTELLLFFGNWKS